MGLGLGLPLLLLAGGPAGAAAQAPPGPLPPSALKGKPKPLETCAAVTVSSSEPCQVKKRGQKLVLKGPAVTVSSLEDSSGAEYDMKPKQFAKDYKQSYPSGEGPTADVLGQVAVALDSLKYKKKKDTMAFTVDPSDGAALKALDPADTCEVEFLTPCDAPPPTPPTPGGACTYSDTACAAGSTCPGGTAVSAECADPAGDGNPCACTALQELAAMSPSLQAEAPWNDLTSNSYCNKGLAGDYDYDYEVGPQVQCTVVDGVELPTNIYIAADYVGDDGLAGALPPSIGELRSSLTVLDLNDNAITSLPTEIGALTDLAILDLSFNGLSSVPTEVGALAGLTFLGLSSNALTSVPSEIGALTLRFLFLNDNALTGVPSDFRTIAPSNFCRFDENPSFSCANVGAGTKCCTKDNCSNGGTSTCYAG